MATATTKPRTKSKAKPKATTRKRRKTAATKAKVKTTTRQPLDEAGLKEAEAELRKSYPKIAKGSLKNCGDDPEKNPMYAHKRTVEITCAKRGCTNTRRVATSDLHQVTMCEACTKRARMDRKNLARRKAK